MGATLVLVFRKQRVSRFPAPMRKDHQRFCEAEGWTLVRNARGGTGTHHVIYELVLSGGAILRTRISHPPDRSTVGKAMWSHILTDQLHVTEHQFWACVRGEAIPERGVPTPRPDAIPASIAHQLIVRFRVPESEVAAMSKQQAIERLAQLWSALDE